MEEDNNEIVIGSSIKPPINLDTNLRKALLKALIELENEDKEKYDLNTRNDYVNIITHLDNRDKNFEKASATAVSYITKSEPVNMTITVKKSTSKSNQMVVQNRKNSTQRQTIHEKGDLDISDTPEHFVASASSSFTSGKVKSEKLGDQKISSGVSILNSLTPRIKESKLQFEKTTTVRPTTTEESEANVESLQFFSAPLVAAFTVHQDEKGLPKSVVPIYNQPGVLTNAAGKQMEKETKGRDGLRQDVFKQHESNDGRADELRQRQKKLEDEIRRLTKLQEEQERIIKEQRLAYEQKIFEQQKKLFAEQTRLFNNVQPFVPILTTTPKPIFHSSNQPSNFESSRNTAATLVSVQPSLRFVQATTNSGSLPFNAQILPVKNAIDFRTPFAQNLRHFRDQDSIISLSPNSLSRPLNIGVPLGLNVRNFLSGNTIQHPLGTRNFHHSTQNNNFFPGLPAVQHKTSFRQIPSVTHTTTTQNLPFISLPPTFREAEITPQQHGTRHLRQETGTGNFFNKNALSSPNGNSDLSTDSRFNRNPLYLVGVSQPTELSRQNLFGSSSPMSLAQYNTLQYSVDEPFRNQRLNNLLYFSGLSQGRQQEDLNIVSKVLSLNHLGGGDPQLATSSVNSPIIRPSTIWSAQ